MAFVVQGVPLMRRSRAGKIILIGLLVPVGVVAGLWASLSVWVPLRADSLHDRLEREFSKARFPAGYELLAVRGNGGSGFLGDAPGLSVIFRVDIPPAGRGRLFEDLVRSLGRQRFRPSKNPGDAPAVDTRFCSAYLAGDELFFITDYSPSRDSLGDCPTSDWDRVFLRVLVVFN